MHIVLTPLADEPEPNDPAHAGEWAGAFSHADSCSPPWCFYFVRLDERPVGVGLFKGPPTDGFVEIAYLVFIGSRGRGVATAIAKELVSIAREHGAVRVVAHTLREPSPSTLVLEANGFTGPAEVVDPEDGPVWRWDLAL
ncbi:GNAT family N-acetyltransferase [Sphingopyxis sp.]|jgi:RimJ/RimL family protein N-acetyltransferase|uniref:GNAT family N-acetyltransferase n=1 Tax=Sphingopyxis sp. TaxID=1908224 RepID=UPI00344BE306|nr:GNAT family N-acetyltransferase [Sphingopyxis sp.]